MSNDLVILSKSELLKRIPHSHPHLAEPLIDLLNKAQLVDSEGVGTLEVDKYGAYGFTLAPYVEFMVGGKHKLYLTPQPAIPEGFVLAPIEPNIDMLYAMLLAYQNAQWNSDSWESAFSIAYKAMLSAAKKEG